ncbi:hypothetical protein CLU84_0644 [Comamonas sp. 26]|nr:hypothetical protein CLU84_0644 [Comamonas sp. 26]
MAARCPGAITWASIDMATSASTVGLPEDKSYLLHHFHCNTCISAGATPGKQARCADGLRLWNLYLRAYQAQQRKG